MQVALLRIEIGVCALVTGAWWDPQYVTLQSIGTVGASS
jgi:hypothetical protein